MTRYVRHDIEDIPTTQVSGPLDPVPSEHTMPEVDNESSNEYCEETDTNPSLHWIIRTVLATKRPIHQFEIYHPPIYIYGRANASHR